MDSWTHGGCRRRSGIAGYMWTVLPVARGPWVREFMTNKPVRGREENISSININYCTSSHPNSFVLLFFASCRQLYSQVSTLPSISVAEMMMIKNIKISKITGFGQSTDGLLRVRHRCKQSFRIRPRMAGRKHPHFSSHPVASISKASFLITSGNRLSRQ